MRRRGHGEGTVFQRPNGLWEGAVTLEGGKRKHFYGKSRREVADKVTRAIRDVAEGKAIVPEKQSVAQFLAQWLEVTKPTVKASTFVRYEEFVRLHIVPYLGKTKLARITPKDLQKLYAKKLEEGLCATTVVQLHRILHRALSQALRWGLVAVNKCEAVDPPRKTRRDMNTLAPEEARRLLWAAKGTRFECLYVLALSTGLRQGELLGLRWKDVDLTRERLHVVTTLHRGHHGLTLSEPKTSRSRRQVLLTEAARRSLREHRKKQAEERLRAGQLWEDNDLVFANEIGKPMDAGNILRRHFWPVLKKAGLSRIRFHDLRHSAATLLLGQGINPKVIQEMLGHSSITITLDVYSHVLPTMQREAKEAMDAILQG